jgi:hypothetical protein
MRRLPVLVVAAPLVLMLAASCGGGEQEVPVQPAKIDAALIPPTLANGELVLREDEKAADAFASLPDSALVADGRLYAIRLGERLVATLQISTLLPEIDLTDPDRYEEVRKKLLPGVGEELSVADVEVFEVAGDDKVVYVWFGRHMFQVLQIKGSKVAPEEILAEVIAFQQASPAWEPLPQTEEEF